MSISVTTSRCRGFTWALLVSVLELLASPFPKPPVSRAPADGLLWVSSTATDQLPTRRRRGAVRDTRSISLPTMLRNDRTADVYVAPATGRVGLDGTRATGDLAPDAAAALTVLRTEAKLARTKGAMFGLPTAPSNAPAAGSPR